MTIIGVITNDANNVFQSEVISGIRHVADARGYAVAVDSIAPEGETPRSVTLDINALDGLLVIANVLPDDMLGGLHRSNKPLSLVSHRVPGTAIPSVIPDNVGGIESLVDYLVLKRGKRRIAFIRGDMNQNDGVERDRAFRRGLMRHNIDIDEALFLRGDFVPSVAADSMRDFLAAGVPFDAVAGADYLMAIAAMDAAREVDIAPPCVVGFGDGPEATEAGLTTIGVDVEQIGRRAAKQLIGQIEGLRICGVTLLSTNIVERESC